MQPTTTEITSEDYFTCAKKLVLNLKGRRNRIDVIEHTLYLTKRYLFLGGQCTKDELYNMMVVALTRSSFLRLHQEVDIQNVGSYMSAAVFQDLKRRFDLLLHYNFHYDAFYDYVTDFAHSMDFSNENISKTKVFCFAYIASFSSYDVKSLKERAHLVCLFLVGCSEKALIPPNDTEMVSFLSSHYKLTYVIPTRGVITQCGEGDYKSEVIPIIEKTEIVRIGAAPACGKGTYGDVRSVEFKGKRCALKRFVLIEEDNDEQDMVTELSILSVVSHQFIIKPFAIIPLYGMLMDKASCDLLVFQNGMGGKLCDELCITIANNLSSAIHYLHNRGIIHRDIKPENILVFPNGIFKFCDFGTSKSNVMNPHGRGAFNMPENVCTNWYRAPELMLDFRGKYGTSFDIWSFGCVVYFCTVGEHLLGHNVTDYEPEGYRHILKKYMNDKPTLNQLSYRQLKSFKLSFKRVKNDKIRKFIEESVVIDKKNRKLELIK